MILPIVAYGDPVLRKVGAEIDSDYPNLEALIVNMKETMYKASGVGSVSYTHLTLPTIYSV